MLFSALFLIRFYRTFDFCMLNLLSSNCIRMCYRNLIVMPVDTVTAGETSGAELDVERLASLTPHWMVQSNDSRKYKGCPERIQPFWIYLEPAAWSWCNSAFSLRKPYCASVNSHSSVGLVSRQWDAVDWACVLSHSHISSLSTAILALGKARSRGEPNLGCRGADKPGWCDALSKKPAREL